uniref:EGF-like domain-containing protein n=1 Tax=Macrostomum lignano TaxID=282301 RepID=A0A1I8F3B1_9PLAT
LARRRQTCLADLQTRKSSLFFGGFRPKLATNSASEDRRVYRVDLPVALLVRTAEVANGMSMQLAGAAPDQLSKPVQSTEANCRGSTCTCFQGFMGPDCSVADTLEICSGNGYLDRGVCRCTAQWKGPECEVPLV